MRDENLHAFVASSTFQGQNAQSTPGSQHFWKVELFNKCMPLWREANLEVKSVEAEGPRPLLVVQMWFCVVGAGDSAPCQKWAKRDGFVAVPKTVAGVGHLNRICKDPCRVAGALQETCSSEMWVGQGRDFLWGVAFWSVTSSGLLRWFCVTGAALRYDRASLSRGRREAVDRWNGKSAEGNGMRPSSLHSTFCFWRKSRRTASFFKTDR